MTYRTADAAGTVIFSSVGGCVRRYIKFGKNKKITILRYVGRTDVLWN